MLIQKVQFVYIFFLFLRSKANPDISYIHMMSQQKDEKVPLATAAVLSEDGLSPLNYEPVIKLANLAAIPHKSSPMALKPYHGVLLQRLITKKDIEGNSLSAVRNIHSVEGSRQAIISVMKVCYLSCGLLCV